MIQAIHHLQVTVPKADEARAREFYLHHLGLTEIPKDPKACQGGFWTKIERVELHVSLEEGVDRQKTRSHVCFLVEDLEIVKKGFESLGIQSQAGHRLTG